MKKLIILFLIFCATLTNAQEKGYWVCFNVEVDADGAGDFVQSLDNFMKAGAFGEVESTKGCSASVMIGKTCKLGAGLCDIVLENPVV